MVQQKLKSLSRRTSSSHFTPLSFSRIFSAPKTGPTNGCWCGALPTVGANSEIGEMHGRRIFENAVVAGRRRTVASGTENISQRILSLAFLTSVDPGASETEETDSIHVYRGSIHATWTRGHSFHIVRVTIRRSSSTQRQSNSQQLQLQLQHPTPILAQPTGTARNRKMKPLK